MKLLGIDYGRRRIGIVTTDPCGISISAFEIIDQKKCTNSVDTLAARIQHHAPEKVIFGVPLGPQNQETELSREIRAFAQKVKEKLPGDIPFYFVDESYSSMYAQAHLRQYKKKTRRKKENIDKFAAWYIIESFKRECQCDNGS